ncbi:MAG TPA: response regulator transcription factor [Bacteroidetes bacterium]|nr:response regulator transcription factor [Bacteroidota bacterium]
MTKLKCLIVEDEPLAAEGLEAFIAQVPFLEMAGNCPDALSALDFIKNKKVDVIFLDIHLPKLKGLDFLKSLRTPPQVILTTAYHQYALEGYELSVVDYLLKPFGFARFLSAVNKLKIINSPKNNIPENIKIQERPFHFFNENKKMVKIYNDEILYIESLKEYVKIYLSDGRSVVTRFQIGEINTFLGDGNLLRIHRSFIVAVDKINAYSAKTIEVQGTELPIGRGYRAQVEERLKS